MSEPLITGHHPRRVGESTVDLAAYSDELDALRAKLAAAEAVVEAARPVTHAQATVYARNQHFKAKELALHYNGLAIAIQRAIEKWDALSPKETPGE